MKIILVTLFLLGIQQASTAQTNCFTFVNDTVESCPGVSADFSAIPSTQYTALQENVDFNSGGLPTGWSVGGGSTFTQPCGNGSDNTPYYWASTAGTGTPFIESPSYDFSNGGVVRFDMYYPEQQGSQFSPCDGPDFENEGISLLYSIDNGATWTEVIYYHPGGYTLPANPNVIGTAPTGTTPYNSWNQMTLVIPNAAMTSNTKIRWDQFESSGTCCDNWGVDNIEVEASLPGISYLWSNGDTTLSMTDASLVDTTFTISMFDANNSLVCEDTVFLEVLDNNFDLGVQAIAGPFIQGQGASLVFHSYNEGCVPQNGQVVIKLDTLLSFNSSSPMPNIITPDSLIYNYSNLSVFSSDFIIYMNVLTSTQAVIGDSVSVDVQITPVSGDIVPANNAKDYLYKVAASYDPNDKKVYPRGDCDVGYVPNDQLMTYTIRFQNTGTSEAIDIRVNDILDSNLDPATVRVVASSHNLELDWVSPTIVDFVFDSILLAPQSVSEIESTGYVVFEIEQVQGLAHGTPFSNQVDIFFDFNAPITTNEVLNTVTDGSHYVVSDTLTISAQSAYNWNGQLLTSSGIYTQVFALPDGCDSTAILSLSLESDAGLNPLSNGPFEIYPNPASDHLTVKGNQQGDLRLINSSGVVVLEKKIDGNDTIMWGKLADGMYIVEISSNNRTYREKLIIEQ